MQSIRRRRVFIQEETRQRGEPDATTSAWKERPDGFGSGVGLYGHVLCLWTDRRTGVSPCPSALRGTWRQFPRYSRNLWSAQERRAGGQVSKPITQQNCSGYKIRFPVRS